MKKKQNPIAVLLLGVCVLSIGIAFGLSEGGVALAGSVPGRGTFNPGGMAVASTNAAHTLGFIGIFFGMTILTLYFKLRSDLNREYERNKAPEDESEDKESGM